MATKTKLFGHYLVDEGKITKDQLIEAVVMQRGHNLSFGLWAVELGFITQDQLKDIHNSDKEVPMAQYLEDKNLLNQEQLTAVIEKKRKTDMHVADILCEKGYIGKEDIDSYEKEYGAEDSDGYLLEDSPEYESLQDFIAFTRTYFKRNLNMDPNQVKLSDSAEEFSNYDYVVCQDVTGDREFTYCMLLSSKMLLHISATMFMYETDEVDDDVLDAGKEFANTVTGEASVKISKEGINTMLNPPVHYTLDEFKNKCGDGFYEMIFGNQGYQLGFILKKET